MIDEMRYAELLNLYKDLIDTYKIMFKRIHHIGPMEPFYYDTIQPIASYLFVNGEISDEKIDFIINFFSKFVGPMDDLKSELKLRPCPLKVGYEITVTFKTFVKVDNLLGDYHLTAKYYNFFQLAFEYLKDVFEDISFDAYFDVGTYLQSLKNYACDTLNRISDFYNFI